jgi:hypothetical protein
MNGSEQFFSIVLGILALLGLIYSLAVMIGGHRGAELEEQLDKQEEESELDKYCDCYCRDCHRIEDCTIYSKYGRGI